jgi:hypothetical protein
MQIATMNQTINVKYFRTSILLATGERKRSIGNIKWNFDEAKSGPVSSSRIESKENSLIVQ